MARTPAPTQADVLRERASRVPWRRAFGDVVRGLAGRGPMERPDRLEGALYGHVLAPGAPTGHADVLLDEVEAMLSGSPERPAGAAVHELALAASLALRGEPERTMLAAIAATAPAGPGSASVTASAMLYALVVRRLLDGQRDRRDALGRARRQALRAGPEPIRMALRAGDPPPFESAWQGFQRARDADAALVAASDLAGIDVTSAAIVGGLAGSLWGSSRLSGLQHRQSSAGARARRLVDRLIESDDPSGDGRGWQTSTSAPLVVHEVDSSGLDPAVAGRIGITPLPGRRYVAYHTGAHWRDLDTDARRLRELGTDLLFLLVEDRELSRCRVTAIDTVLRDHAIELVRYPIRDPLVPRDRASFRACVTDVLEAARRGRGVVVACRGGFDRAGMTAACLLREAGLGASTAIDRVQRARPGALTLPDQQAYVRAWPTL